MLTVDDALRIFDRGTSLNEEAQQVIVAAIRHLKDRETFFAAALKVSDGGQYRNDWPGAVERCVRDRDEALARVATLEAVLPLASAYIREHISTGDPKDPGSRAGGRRDLARINALIDTKIVLG